MSVYPSVFISLKFLGFVYCYNGVNVIKLTRIFCNLQRPELGLNSIPSAPKATALPNKLKEISTWSFSRGYLHLLWCLNVQAITLILLQTDHFTRFIKYCILIYYGFWRWLSQKRKRNKVKPNYFIYISVILKSN